MTIAEFLDKWASLTGRFKDNLTFDIDEGDLREFAADMVTVFGVEITSVLPYIPGTVYAVSNLIRYTLLPANESFYYALKAGKLPAPVATGDTNWKVVPGPVLATALSQAVTLLEAQGLEGTGVVAGRTYVIDFGPNAAGNAQLVTLLGTASNLFAIRGQLTVNGVRSNVRVNVASGVFGEEVSLLASDNNFTGTNTFSKQTTVLDLLVSSVQNTTLNTYSKLAAFVQGLVARLGATTAADPAAPTSKLVGPGWGMQQTGNALGLLRDVSRVQLPPGLPGIYLNTQDGSTAAVTVNASTSPLIAVEPGSRVTFLKPVTGVCFYDSNGVFLSGGGTVTGDLTVPANAYFMRLMAKTNSGADTGRLGINSVYGEVSYQLGNLPYVTGIQTAAGVLKPNAVGVVDGTRLGGGGVASSSGTVLVFTQDAEYAPLYSGTFTVDTTGAKVGVVVKAELGPSTTQPVLDPSVFELVGSGTYQATKRLGYGFCVAASGKIEYFIYTKP